MRARLRNSLLVCAFALALAGCGDGGDDGTIPPGEADDLLALLAAVEKYADEGNCELAQENAAELIDRVNTLPNDVDPEVAGELTKASDHLRELAADPGECTGASGETGVQPTDTTETDTDTTEPETTVTETTTPEEETTTDEAPEEEKPPTTGGGNEGGGQGGGNQGGGNQGGGVTPQESGGLEPPSGGGNG